MDAKQMLELVRLYQDNKDFITNEETAKMALVVPFIRLLGYNPNSPREVRLEYTAEFTQGDGKRLADRMDFAIFDASGVKPLIVIETKPLGTDLQSRCNQLARYIAQMPDLHFGIITDGCEYLLFGDLDNPNQMDGDPFFRFSLSEDDADWSKIAKFLGKFSRDSFNAETLLRDAENSRYRQAMVDKLVAVLRDPASDDSFMRFLTDDVYKGKRTANVMARFNDLAKEAIEPALLRVMGDDFLAKLRERIERINENGEGDEEQDDRLTDDAETSPSDEERKSQRHSAIVTTEDELEFFETVKAICAREQIDVEQILARDTVNYFNVSYRKPTKWFLRYFTNGKRRAIVTPLPVEEVRALVGEFECEEAPSAFGTSRIYIDYPAQMWALGELVIRSFQRAAGEDLAANA